LQLQLQLGAFIWCPWTRGSQPKYVVSPTEVGCAMARRRQLMLVAEEDQALRSGPVVKEIDESIDESCMIEEVGMLSHCGDGR